MPLLPEVTQIFLEVILPVFVLIGIGVVFERLLKPDLRTLSQLNFYVFVPALVFVKVLDSSLDWGSASRVAGGALVLVGSMYGVTWFACRRIACLREHQRIVPLGSAFFNSGNYGIPFAQLAFGDAGVAGMAVILMVQNLASFTLGVCVLEGRRGPLKLIVGLLKTPVILAIGIALVLRIMGLRPPSQIGIPLEHLANGLVPIALLTLGVQLSRSQGGKNGQALALACCFRLLLSPVLAVPIALLFGIGGVQGQVFMAAAGLPTAVNVFILASRYGEDAELASRIVFMTTLLSAVSVALLLALVRAWS